MCLTGAIRPEIHLPAERAAIDVRSRALPGEMYSTLDNTDSVSGVYGAFDTFFVVDARIRYLFSEMLSADFGIDNLLDRKYVLFHPFPGG